MGIAQTAHSRANVGVVYFTKLAIMELKTGCKRHAGTQRYAVMPLSFAGKPQKCGENARHDLWHGLFVKSEKGLDLILIISNGSVTEMWPCRLLPPSAK